MNERMISFLMVPLLISYQSSNILLSDEYTITKEDKHFQIDQMTVDTEENLLIVENEHQDSFKKKLLLQKKMADIEEQAAVLNDSNETAQLGMILASMSGTILFGERALALTKE
ncbi:hypothetical protein IGI37_002205 [Enterococcus sp. AZ194]|uniref:hypothetical protein n=1 Tax=Enterococcus sp. AZ194 TaxID=2774629 RepID=UPI003F239E1C